MNVFQDIKYGIRVLIKSPGFVLAAVLSLALGIGANTTIFTMVNAVFLQPLPVENVSELMYVYGTDENNRQSIMGTFLPVSYPNYKDYREQQNVFTGLGVYSFFPTQASLGGGEKPAPINVQLVSGNYFDVLGVKAAMGRTFLEDEDRTPATHPVAVLNYQAWQRRFGGNTSIVGQQIRINGNAFTIIGIAARGFDGTFGMLAPDLWVPVMAFPLVQSNIYPGGPLHTNRRLISFSVFGRLKPGVSMSQAQTAMQTIGRRLEEEYPNDNDGRSVGVMPLSQATIPPAFRGVIMQGSGLLMAIVGFILLIACANIANLMMARATARRREFTVRLALGGARSRLISQLLTESVLVAVPGGLLALLIAVAGRDLILSLLPQVANVNNLNLPLDTAVLAFTVAISIASGLLFGIAPALNASRSNLVEDLKDRSGGASGHGWLSVRSFLIFVQVGLSVIALASAGLFIRSLSNAQNADLGLAHDHLVVVQYDVGSNGYTPDRGREFHRRVLERMRTLPGAEAAAFASGPPMQPMFQRSVFPEGRENAGNNRGVLVFANTVVPEYFDTVRMPILRGRNLSDADREGQPLVVVINEAMARRFWPDQDAIGKRFKFFGDEEFRTVVGITRTTKVLFVGEDPQSMAYIPLEQSYSPNLTLHLRAAGPPELLKATIEREMQSLDPDIALNQVWAGDELLELSLWGPRLAATLLAIFGVIALVLAAVGIYGVMSYSVNQRASEIGIRMALGAQRGDVLQMILGQGMVVVVVGLAVGIVVAAGISRALSGLLYGVGTFDIPAFAGTAAVLLVVAFVANWLPARRATHVDPVDVMRYE